MEIHYYLHMYMLFYYKTFIKQITTQVLLLYLGLYFYVNVFPFYVRCFEYPEKHYINVTNYYLLQQEHCVAKPYCLKY